MKVQLLVEKCEIAKRIDTAVSKRIDLTPYGAVNFFNRQNYRNVHINVRVALFHIIDHPFELRIKFGMREYKVTKNQKQELIQELVK